MFRAIDTYDGSQFAQSISLVPGDVLISVQTLDDEWYRGYNKRSGETGAFPRNFVVEVENGNKLVPEKKTDVPRSPIIPSDVAKQRGNKSDTPNKPAAVKPTSEGNKKDIPRLPITPSDLSRRQGYNPDIPTKSTSAKDSASKNDKKIQGVSVIPGPNNNILQSTRFGKASEIELIIGQGSMLPGKRSESKMSTNGNNGSALGQHDVKIQNLNISSGGITEDGGPYKASTFKAMVSGAGMFFSSGRDENKKIKALIGVVAGLIIGGLLFVLLYYSFGYSYEESGIIAGSVTGVMCICLALSTQFRCVTALVFPNLFSGEGRAVVLSIIFGLMISNQISNITYNAKETGNSLSCITELAANQTHALRREFTKSANEMADYVKRQQEQLKQATQTISDAIQVITDVVEEIDNGIDKAKKALSDVEQKCRNGMWHVVDACNKACKVDFLKSEVNEALSFLDVEMEVEGGYTSKSGTTEDLPDIKQAVNAAIEEKTEALQAILTFCKKFLSLSLALIFLQAFRYMRNYLSKDEFDNIYITKQFRQLDKEAKAQGRENILPLKKKEASVYVNTLSWKLNSTELGYCKFGLFQVFFHFLLCLLVVVFDVSLYYILEVVGKYGVVELDVEGQGGLKVNIKGKGPIADLYRSMVGGVDIDQDFNINFDLGHCLPKPSPPSFGTLPTLLILYCVALCFVLLRGYGLRLRRKIAAFYYPEQELARLEYLQQKILNKRVSFLHFLRQQLKSSHKKSAMRRKLYLTTWLRFRFPILTKCIPSQDNKECTGCQQRESSLRGIQIEKCPGEKGSVPCNAAYCQDCKMVLKDGCPLCSNEDQYVALRY